MPSTWRVVFVPPWVARPCGLLIAMMRQSAKVERFKQTQDPLDALHAKYDTGTGDRWLVNAGSVGQPRDGDWRAGWTLLDLDAGRIEDPGPSDARSQALAAIADRTVAAQTSLSRLEATATTEAARGTVVAATDALAALRTAFDGYVAARGRSIAGEGTDLAVDGSAALLQDGLLTVVGQGGVQTLRVEEIDE